MKIILGIIGFALAVKGAMWIGKKLAKDDNDDDFEPMNNREDQSNSLFV
jgi:hypothetical protein